MKAKFFKCDSCNNIFLQIEGSDSKISCCNNEMKKILSSSVDASIEKHVPVYTVKGSKVHVKVGSIEHPSTAEHYIQWIGLTTDNGIQIKMLKPLDKPQACFRICDDEKVLQVFCYCNLHGKWSS